MKIISFDGLALNPYEITDDIPLAMVTASITVPGMHGAFDVWGDEQHRQPLTITRRFEIIGDDYADVDDQLDAIRAKTNTRGWLAIEMRDGDERGTWAKLTQVSAPEKPEYYTHLPVTLTFVALWPWFESADDVWYFDAGETFDDGLYFDGNYTTQSGSGTFAINNTGGGPITRGIIEIRGAATNPTITNAANDWSLAYSGTVPSGTSLFIDIGAQTAIINGENVWSNITLGDYNTGLMRLETGANSIVYTGGGTLVWHWARVY